jgi:putative transposase
VSLFRFIAAEKANHSISLMCTLLGVSRSGFHAWARRPPSDRALADAWLVERIVRIHRDSRGTYGARRVDAALHQQGIRVGRKRVERLMRAQRLTGAVPRKRARTTIRVPGVRAAADLVARDFVPAAPNQLWVADITYIRLQPAGCTSPRLSTVSPAASSAGRCATTSVPSSSSTRSRWPPRAVSRGQA